MSVIQEVATKKDYTTVIACNNYDTQRAQKQINDLISSYTAGFIIGSGPPLSEEIKRIQKLNIPVVSLDTPAEDKKTPSVMVDVYSAFYDAVKYLIDNGHNDIYYLHV